MATKLTQRTVDAARPDPSGRDAFVWDGGDGGVKGFGVRVKKSGAKSFVVQYRNGHRQSKRFTVGSASVLRVEQARDKARKLLAGVTDGDDPATQKAASRNPAAFKALVERFIKDYAKPRNRHYKHVERTFELHVIPKWGTRPVASIERRDVRELLRGVAEGSGPIAANRVLAAVRKLFNWAASEDLVPASPVAGVQPPSPERVRDRVLGDDEIRSLWSAFATVPVFGAAFKMMLVTGQRRSEVARMRWADLSLDDRATAIWTIPGASNKAGRDHLVPLSDLALDILDSIAVRGWKDAAGHDVDRPDYVFTTNMRAPISGFSKAKLAVSEAVTTANAELPERDCVLLADWRLHDLRRTAATNMPRFGADRFIVARVLNHADPSVTGRYDRYLYADEKRRALDQWARGLALILNPPGDNIVPMRQPA